MRGKVAICGRLATAAGITPAYAGKSSLSVYLPCSRGDHPRLCGEKLVTSGNSGVGLGSPPPMRGKVRKMEQRKKPIGITPAYAGKSPERCICPHSLVGSPPPMRGKGTNKTEIKLCCRITPAYAGKSCKASTQLFHRRDHPRLCGEKQESRH